VYILLDRAYPWRRFLASGNLSCPSLSKNVIIPLWYVSKYSSQCIFLISNGNSVWSSLFKLFHKLCTFLLLNIHSLVEKYSSMSVNLPIFLYWSTNLKSYTSIMLYFRRCRIFSVRYNLWRPTNRVYGKTKTKYPQTWVYFPCKWTLNPTGTRADNVIPGRRACVKTPTRSLSMSDTTWP